MIDFVPADTTREAALVQLQIYKKMTPQRRLELAFALSAELRELVASGVRARHPDYDDNQVRLAVARLTLGDKLFGAAYPQERIDI